VPDSKSHKFRPNSVCIPGSISQDKADEFVAYNFIVQNCLSREAIGEHLRQCRAASTCHTPHLLNSMVAEIVDLYEKKVDCCSAGCVAFTARRKNLTECDICKDTRCRSDGKPHKQVTYWPLLPWIRVLLADPDIGPDMVNAIKEAWEAAGTSPVEDIRDWFNGAIFRHPVELGYFSTNTCVALNNSTHCFQAWRQSGFEGWPVIVTILSVSPSSRVQVVSQNIICITPDRDNLSIWSDSCTQSLTSARF